MVGVGVNGDPTVGTGIVRADEILSRSAVSGPNGWHPARTNPAVRLQIRNTREPSLRFPYSHVAQTTVWFFPLARRPDHHGYTTGRQQMANACLGYIAGH